MRRNLRGVVAALEQEELEQTTEQPKNEVTTETPAAETTETPMETPAEVTAETPADTPAAVDENTEHPVEETSPLADAADQHAAAAAAATAEAATSTTSSEETTPPVDAASGEAAADAAVAETTEETTELAAEPAAEVTDTPATDEPAASTETPPAETSDAPVAETPADTPAAETPADSTDAAATAATDTPAAETPAATGTDSEAAGTEEVQVDQDAAAVTTDGETVTADADPAQTEVTENGEGAGETTDGEPAAQEIAEVPAAEVAPAETVDAAATVEAPAVTDVDATTSEEAIDESLNAEDDDGAIDDMAEQAEEAEAQGDEVQEAAEAVDALESIRDLLVASLPNGGVLKNDAGAYRIATETICGNIGLHDVRLPALEEFAAPSARVRSTQLAIESIGETVKKIIAAIIRAVKLSIAWLSEHFTQIFHNASALHSRADRLIKTASQVQDGAAPKAESIDNQRLFWALALPSGFEAKAVTRAVYEAVDHFLSPRTELFAALVKLLDNKGSLEAATELAQVAAERPTAMEPLESRAHIQVPQGMKGWRSEPLPGGKQILAFLPDDGPNVSDEQVLNMLSHSMVKVFDGWLDAAEVEAKPLPVATPHDAAELAKAVQQILKKLGDFKAAQEHIVVDKKRVLAALQELEKSEDAEQRAIAKLSTFVTRMVDQPVANLGVYVLRSCKSVLDYCAASLQQYVPSLAEQSAAAAKTVADGAKEVGGAAVDGFKEGLKEAADGYVAAGKAVHDGVANLAAAGKEAAGTVAGAGKAVGEKVVEKVKSAAGGKKEEPAAA